MRITKITHEKAPVEALDTEADEGYLQGPGRVLADVDVDYQADRRQEVKEYLERRYNIEGRQRVFSASLISSSRKSGCATLMRASAFSQVVRPLRLTQPYSVQR